MDDAARDRIVAKLRLLVKQGRDRSELGPPATDDALALFEAQHHVRVPSGYRRFLRELGEGGAGPGWGLVTLPSWADAWSDYGEPDPLSPSRAVALPDAGVLDPARLATQLRGFITLADQGAERWWLLEVSGPEAGRVWRWESLESLPRPFAAFAEWYERWLDESIAGLDDTSFGAFRPGNDTELLLRSADPNPDVRADTAGELGRRREPSDAVRAALQQLMRDPEPAVRAAALRHGEHAADAADVLAGLNDPDVSVQRVAAFRMRRGSPRPSRADLEARLRSVDDPTVLSLLGQVLGEQGELSVEVLGSVLNHDDPAVRSKAVAVLRLATPPPQAEAALVRALDDPSAEVRQAAVEALPAWPGSEAKLRAMQTSERDPKVRAALLRALAPQADG
ncbi:MAG: HEAT repeat domain-containing protein [Sandaracinaceae bacterium]